jgi:hypothetical protein
LRDRQARAEDEAAAVHGARSQLAAIEVDPLAEREVQTCYPATYEVIAPDTSSEDFEIAFCSSS